MGAEQWNRVKSIFAHAVELRGPDRTKYLDEACGDDTELHTEVRVLLREHDQTGSLVPRPREAPALEPGAMLGDRFRIVRLVGRGGMGEVYEAEDQELGTRIALKTLRSTLGAGEDFLERIRREVRLDELRRQRGDPVAPPRERSDDLNVGNGMTPAPPGRATSNSSFFAVELGEGLRLADSRPDERDETDGQAEAEQHAADHPLALVAEPEVDSARAEK